MALISSFSPRAVRIGVCNWEKCKSGSWQDGRYEDADAASGPCARGDALQGVEPVDGTDRLISTCADATADEWDKAPHETLQGPAVQLFRVSQEGRPPNEQDAAADCEAAVFGAVI